MKDTNITISENNTTYHAYNVRVFGTKEDDTCRMWVVWDNGSHVDMHVYDYTKENGWELFSHSRRRQCVHPTLELIDAVYNAALA